MFERSHLKNRQEHGFSSHASKVRRAAFERESDDTAVIADCIEAN
ncbi:hypothetical protein SAMN02744124_03045 [Paenibacillus barengoltzii J12]|uniref:Uncharacterized protein n=1 Tax=Paenibacillus barengoltzii J12 TaxID=935846 RepID=A0ABY1M2Q1_9BACL|nr:hypothetical protein SAMN02744124_03045 [Paenibacillus barengoltzii J12]